jgi:hypothetical protein
MPLLENCGSTSLFATVYKRLAEGGYGWLLVRLAATDDAAGSCCCVSESLRTETLRVMLEIRGNMGQCESKNREEERLYRIRKK